MSGPLLRKLRRDVVRQRWQFLALALVVAIGVSVYVAASDAFANLQESFDRAYAEQRLPDAILSGASTVSLRDEAERLPGDPIVEVRQQGELGIRIDDTTFLGRVVGVPAGAQPQVSTLALQSGDLPLPEEVAVEQHVADHYSLEPGDVIELLGPTGWQRVRVSGSALSTEYFWPARSRQEVLTTPEHFGVAFMPASDLAAVVADPVDQLLIYARDRGAAGELVDGARTLAQSAGAAFADRDGQPSYRTLQDDVESIGTFARLLPWVFLTAAMLATFVLLSRLVSAQRAVIGTLVANGLSAGALRRHYLGYGLVAGAGGAVPGVALGLLLGMWFTSLYTEAIGLPLSVTALHAENLLIAAAAGVTAAALAAVVPAWAAGRTSPAEAMRIAPAVGRGGTSLAERVLPPLRRLPARWRMTLRGITRNRRRTALTIAGVAVAVSLVMVFAGLRDTVATLIDRQFGSIQLEDAQVLTAPGTTAAVLAEVRDDPDIDGAEAFARHEVTLDVGGRSTDTLLLALDSQTAMHRFVSDGQERPLPDDGILLGEGARTTLGATAGDTVTLTVTPSGERIRERVAGFVDEPLGAVAYISIDRLAAASSGLAEPSGILLTLGSGADADAVGNRISARPGVIAYLATAAVEGAMAEAFSLYDVIVGVMLLFAAAMAAALLYNALWANVAERLVELGTLRAAGMGPRLLARLVATENVSLAVLGLPIGLVGGALLADWLMSTYETQGYRLSLEMQPVTPLRVAIGVLVAAVLAQLPSLRTINRMDIAKVVRERSL